MFNSGSLLFLILLNAGSGEVQCSQSTGLELDVVQGSMKPENPTMEIIKELTPGIKEFFANVRAVNFIVNTKDSFEELEKWSGIYETMSEALKDSHCFCFVTQLFSSTGEKSSNNFKRRAFEAEYEGFVVNYGLHDAVSEQNDPGIFRDNGYYLVVVDSPAVSREELLNYLQRAWLKSGSITCIVIYLNQLWTYNPFGMRTENTFGTLTLYGANDRDMKRQRLKNLNGYPLIIEFFESGYNIAFYKNMGQIGNRTFLEQFLGPDSVSVEILRQRMNFTAIFQPPDKGDAFGSKLENGTFTGCLGRMINKKSDLALTGFFIKDYLSTDVEFTSSIYEDQLCLISKKASRIPQSLLPLVCFEVDLWVCLLLTMIFAGVFWSAVRKVNNRIIFHHKKPPSAHQFFQIFVDTAMLTISAPLRKFPKINSERSFVASICLLSLVFVSIFQSSLSTVFIKPIFYKDIMSLADLAETKLPILVKYAAMMQDMFPTGSTGIIGQLHTQMVQISTTSSVMAQLSVAGNFVTVTRRCTTYQDNAYYFSSRLLHMIPECPRIYNLGYMTRRNSIYLRRVNEILMQLNNGGFHEKWIRDLNYKYAWMIRFKYGSFHESAFKVLNLGNLQLPFYILGIGFSISAVVFICEWIKMLSDKCKFIT